MRGLFKFPFLILTVGILHGLSMLANAQMLETIEQCDARYGAAVSPTDKTSDVRFYQQDGVSIKILFIEGKAQVITFSALAGAVLDDQKQHALLEKNASGSKWEEVEGAGPRTWARADGEVFGFYDSSKSELTIMTANYLNKAKEEAQTASAMKSPGN